MKAENKFENSSRWKFVVRSLPIIGICIAFLFMIAPRAALALDPPHAFTNVCAACHLTHNAPGGSITLAAGNANLCISCHAPGGQAPTNAFASADQALAWPGLAVGVTNFGTSHRWDSGLAGFVKYVGGAPFASSGTVSSAGIFTGVYAKTYTITFTVGGTVGGARFNWTATSPAAARARMYLRRQTSC